MLKVIHAADFHLDGTYSGLSPQRAAARRHEQRKFLDELRDLVREREADIVLLAGDLFEGDLVHPETIDMLGQALSQMPCWVFISPGSADYYHDKSPYAIWQWPKNVHIFKDEATRAVTLPATHDKEAVTIYGSSFVSPTKKRAPLEKFKSPTDWSGYHIMVTHAELDGSTPDYAPIHGSQIEKSGLHYLALGSVHNRTAPQRAGRTYYTYPGCAQGRNFSELEAKGVLYLELELEGEANMSFIPLTTRQYHAVAVDITGQDTLLDNLRRGLSQRYTNGRRDIFRVILTGESMGANLHALQEGLQDDFYGLEIVDESEVPQRIWSKKGDETITGMFLAEMAAIAPTGQDDLLDSATFHLALRFGMAALENREDFAQ